eukprot:g51238.t1
MVSMESHVFSVPESGINCYIAGSSANAPLAKKVPSQQDFKICSQVRLCSIHHSELRSLVFFGLFLTVMPVLKRFLRGGNQYVKKVFLKF